MSKWPMVPLGEVADINPKQMTALRDNAPVSFLGMADVSEKGTTSQGIERPYLDVKKGYTPFLNGDILIAKITPCFQNGKIAQAEIKHQFGFGSTEFHVVRPKNDIHPRYIFHYLRRLQVRVDGERMMTGTGGQRRVPAGFIGTLHRKRRAAISTAGQLAQSIFVDLFGDPTINPRRLPIVKLSELGNLDRGISKHRPRNASHLLGGAYPFLQTGDVSNSGGYIYSTERTYSELGLKQSKIRPAGTLCITIAANIAKTAILKIDACFPDSVVGFSAKEPSATEYVRVWISFLQQSLEARAPESAQKNINLAKLRDLPIPCPPSKERTSFAEAMAAVEALRLSYLQAAQQLNNLSASLQSRAFAGEL